MTVASWTATEAAGNILTRTGYINYVKVQLNVTMLLKFQFEHFNNVLKDRGKYIPWPQKKKKKHLVPVSTRLWSGDFDQD